MDKYESIINILKQVSQKKSLANLTNCRTSKNNLINQIQEEYKFNFECDDRGLLEDCFNMKFHSTYDKKLSEISYQLDEILNFLVVSDTVKQLNSVTKIIEKYKTVYIMYKLLSQIDDTFELDELNTYKKAKEDEKLLKQKLKRYGISNKWITEHFNTERKEQNINTNRLEDESYANYMRRMIKNCTYGNYEEMLKVYKTITKKQDWELYDNIKLFVLQLSTNGVNKTPNDVYDSLRGR